jgi:UDP-glucose 4-epimerase
MNILITGGAGFIGSHIAFRLLQDSDECNITIYDNFSSGSWSHLNKIESNERVNVLSSDLKNLELLKEAMKNIDLVIHFAANPDIAKAVTQPDIDFWEGTYLTQNVLEAMRLSGVKKILYTSGSGVYGEVPNQVFHESFGPLFPISTYGASKLACEALISSYCHMFDFQGRAFRFANVVGPKQTHGVGYDFIRRLITNPKELRILGDGTQSKSYIYVSDVINAMLTALKEMDKPNSLKFDLFNVATDDYIDVTEIAKITCEVLNIDFDSLELKYTGGDRGWKGDVPKVLFNVSKIKTLGWSAAYTSRESLKLSISSMKKELLEKNNE